jgi:hypothetical protein
MQPLPTMAVRRPSLFTGLLAGFALSLLLPESLFRRLADNFQRQGRG